MLFPLPQLADALTRLGSLLLCLATITTVFFRLSLPSVRSLRVSRRSLRSRGCSDEACDDPVDVPVSLLLWCWLLGRFGFFTTAEQRFQCPKKRLNSPGCAGVAGVAGAASVLGLQQARQVQLALALAALRHGKGCQRRLFRTLTFSELSSDGSAIASSCSFGSM